MQRIYSFCFIVLLIFLAGCGNGKVSLKGKVTFSDDDSPVPAGTVAFVSGDGKMSRGNIKEDGTYVVWTESDKDGLPPGDYQVFISSALKSTLVDEKYGIYDYEQLILKKYEDPGTSGLSVKVDASTKTYDIKVDRYGGR